MKINTTSPDNYLIDLRPPEQRFNADMKSKMDRLSRVPRNSANVVSQQFRQQINRDGTDFIAPLSEQFADSLASGFYVYASSPLSDWFHYLQSPTAYKISNVNDIGLSLNLSTIDAPGFVTVADSTYTVDFYTAFRIRENVAGQGQGGDENSAQEALFNSQQVNTYLLIQKHVFTHDPSIDTKNYTFTNSNVTYRLSDYITNRPLLHGASVTLPDFNSDPTKIQQFQFEKLASEAVMIYVDFGFDFASYSALTGNNLTHFQEATGYPAFSAGKILVNIDAVFTYAGTFSDYVPLTT